MQEFYVAATNKLGAEALIVKDILHSFERFETIIITSGIIKDAIDYTIVLVQRKLENSTSKISYNGYFHRFL